MVRDKDVIAVWFSSGAASAVAAIKTIEKYGDICDVKLIRSPIKEEHRDNDRFADDISKYTGYDIEIALNEKYPDHSCVTVWNDRKFMSSPFGAPCTTLLKKEARYQWEKRNNPDWHVLGFTYDEKKRHERFIQTERENVIPILIDLQMTKNDCGAFLNKIGIELPKIYSLGFPNANCIGCVKATSPTYWNLVRREFPDVFSERMKQSDDIGVKLARYRGERISLSDLPHDAIGAPMKELDFECGLFCEELLNNG